MISVLCWERTKGVRYVDTRGALGRDRWWQNAKLALPWERLHAAHDMKKGRVGAELRDGGAGARGCQGGMPLCTRGFNL
jgi:hypothetical protein